MNLEQATQWRVLSGRICTAILALFFAAIMDGLVAILRQPVNLVTLLPGESEEISAPLRGEVKDLGEPLVRESHAQVRLIFLETRKGFWLGGDMWRGMVSVDGSASPGDYPLIVYQAGDPSGKPVSAYLVRVFADEEAIKRASKSMILRYGGISPWRLSLFLFPLLLLGLLINYLLADRRDRLLVERGRAEIYHVLRGENGYTASFGLGSQHGLQVGAPITIVDEHEAPVFSGRVERVFKKDAMTTVPLECPVRTGYMVRVDGGLPRAHSRS